MASRQLCNINAAAERLSAMQLCTPSFVLRRFTLADFLSVTFSLKPDEHARRSK